MYAFHTDHGPSNVMTYSTCTHLYLCLTVPAELPSLRSTNQLESSSLEWKTGATVITEEERKLLAEEGIFLPTDMPLTKV